MAVYGLTGGHPCVNDYVISPELSGCYTAILDARENLYIPEWLGVFPVVSLLYSLIKFCILCLVALSSLRGTRLIHLSLTLLGTSIVLILRKIHPHLGICPQAAHLTYYRY